MQDKLILGNQTKLFVSSGSMSMNIDGSLQVLAEEAVKIDEIDEAVSVNKNNIKQCRTRV